MRYLYLFILALISPVFLSGEIPATEDFTDAVITEVLRDMTASSDSISGYDAGSDELMVIIEQIYSGKKREEEMTGNVLEFLTSVYSEHGYLETGSWVQPEKHFYYKPYNGKLPEYTTKDFYYPLKGRVTSTYGYRPKYRKEHHGIDLALQTGDTVRCALPGVVTGVGYDPRGYGNYIIVSHSGDVQTLYGHLQATLAAPGDHVKAGSVIATGGSTGNSTGPHLHFETRFRGKPFDPSSWFDFSNF